MFPFHKFDTNDNKEKELIYSQKMACMIMSLPLLLFWIPIHSGTSLAVQWSCLSFLRRGHGSLSGQGTKIPTGGQEKKRKISFPFRKEGRCRRHPKIQVCIKKKWEKKKKKKQKRGTLVRGYQAGRLLLLWCFCRVQLCATPQTAAHQAPPSLGFSRQEHWSGLPFPSPMHESEKWKWSRSVASNS